MKYYFMQQQLFFFQASHCCHDLASMIHVSCYFLLWCFFWDTHTFIHSIHNTMAASTLSTPVPENVGELREFFRNYSTKINSKTASLKLFDFVVVDRAEVGYVVAQIVEISKENKDSLLLSHIGWCPAKTWTQRSQIFTPNEQKFSQTRGLFHSSYLSHELLNEGTSLMVQQIPLAIKQ